MGACVPQKPKAVYIILAYQTLFLVYKPNYTSFRPYKFSNFRIKSTQKDLPTTCLSTVCRYACDDKE